MPRYAALGGGSDISGAGDATYEDDPLLVLGGRAFSVSAGPDPCVDKTGPAAAIGVGFEEDSASIVTPAIRRRAIWIVGVLVMVNVGVLGMLGVVGASYPSIVGPGLLAFTFGLRHAVDADHIAAIDNVTRKLISDGKRPLTVGLWFSLGHCTVVFVLCTAVAAGSGYIRAHLGNAASVGAIIGTAVSASMLFLIGFINLYIMVKLRRDWRAMRTEQRNQKAAAIDAVRRGQLHDTAHAQGFDHPHDDGMGDHTHLVTVDANGQVESNGPGGILTKCCPVLIRSVNAEWKMYPVGFLFGLGFDTASEIALLALASLGTKDGVPPLCVMLLPLTFGSGMALLDTLDGIMMVWAYGWAMVHPGRKIFFNLYLTGLSAAIAIVVGLVEVLGCVQQQLQLDGPFWGAVDVVNEHFEYVGYSIIGLFLISTVVAVGIYKLRISPSLTVEVSGVDGDGDDAWGEDPQMVSMSTQDEYIRARMLQLAGVGAAQSSVTVQPKAPRTAAERTPERPTAAALESQDDYLRRRMLELAMAPPTPFCMDDCEDGPP